MFLKFDLIILFIIFASSFTNVLSTNFRGRMHTLPYSELAIHGLAPFSAAVLAAILFCIDVIIILT